MNSPRQGREVNEIGLPSERRKICISTDLAAVIESAENSRQSVLGRVLIMGGMILLGVLLLGVFVPTCAHFGPNAFGGNVGRAKDVVALCQIYAGEHGGKFPPLLEAIDPPLDESRPHWQYSDPDSKRPYDWLYFPGATTADGAQRLILASPTAFTQRSKGATVRIVVFADRHSETWPEPQFQEYLKHFAAEPRR